MHFSFAGVTLALGSNAFTVTATDAAGNVGSGGATFTRTLPDTVAPVVSAALSHDTGASATDGVTSDPAVAGSATDNVAVTALSASIDGRTALNILSDRQASGAFALSGARMQQIYGGVIPDGPHTLAVTAADAAGNSTTFSLSFTLDTAAPVTPSLTLDPSTDSAPIGDNQTTFPVVVLRGQTSPNTAVRLVQTGATTVSDGAGVFGFTGVNLTPGPNAFTVVATDPAGNTASGGVTITSVAADMAAPAVSAALSHDTGASATDRITSDAAVAGTATDNVAVTTLTASIDGRAAASILADRQASGAFALSATRMQQVYGGTIPDGAHTLHLVAADAAGNTSTFDLTFTLDTLAPGVTLALDPTTDSPPPGDNQTTFPLVVLRGQTDPNTAVTLVQTGATTTSSATGAFQFNDVAVAVGANTFTARATDAAGNQGSSTVLTVTRVAVVDTTPPSVSITSPASGSVLTAMTAFTGTVTDPNLLFYKLEAAPFAGGAFVEFARGTAQVSNGVLGQFDPSALQNDTYVVRLTATDFAGNTAAITREVSVSGDLKLGNFSLSYVDLTIPMAGMPITVTRTYDTLDSGSRDDFGFGWRMEFRDTDLRDNVPPSGLEDLFIYNGYRDGTRVYLTRPGGKREGFTFRPRVKLQIGTQRLYAPQFVADPGVTSRLTVPTDWTLTLGSDGEFVDVGGGQAYNPRNPIYDGVFVLTAKDGTTYRIDADNGDLQTVTERNNNTLTFSDSGIASTVGPSVTFGRDGSGRITTVTDPKGGQIRYAYDAAGNLTSVTDRAARTTQFQYRANPAHYLERVIDPLGRTGVRSEYDANGRLVRVTSADGHAVDLSVDSGARTQTVADPLGHATVFTYDARGNVIRVVDARGGVTVRTYDANNNMLTETDPLGHTRAFTYDSVGNVLTETDALGNVTRHTYNAQSRILTIVDPLGHTTTNTYDSRGNLLTVTGPGGEVSQFAYDSRGDLTRWQYPNGDVVSVTYDSRGRVTTTTDPTGLVSQLTSDPNGNVLTDRHVLNTAAGPVPVAWTYTYNANDDMTAVVGPDGGLVTLQYDNGGQQTGGVDPLGRATTFNWTAGGLVDTVTGFDGSQYHIGHDDAGRTTTVTLPGGGTVLQEYDELGRRTRAIYPGGAVVINEWDAAGRQTASTDSLGNTTHFIYDDAGRLVEVQRPGGAVTRNSYDASGSVIAVVDAGGSRTTIDRDAYGRATRVGLPDGTSSAVTYDSVGRVSARTDITGGTWSYQYSPGGALVSVTDPAGAVTAFGHDGHGLLNRAIDPLGRATALEFDVSGRLIRQLLPGGQSETRAYDLDGRLVRRTDFDGGVIEYAYDAAGRLVRRSGPGAELEVRTYDLAGNLVGVQDGNGVTAIGLTNGRLDSFTGPGGATVSYGYDLNGRVTSVTTDRGATQFTYNGRGELLGLSDAAGAVSFARDGVGRPTSETLPNGNTISRLYDAVGRASRITYADTTGTVLYRIAYTRDAFGRIATTDESNGRVVRYTYDSRSRVTEERVTTPAGVTVTAYAYDAVGNVTLRTDASGTQTFAYDANDRLVSDGHWTYTWSANGYLIGRADGTTTEAMTYDGQGRLLRLTRSGPAPLDVTYSYDFDGLLASRTVGGVTTRFVWDRGSGGLPQLLEERNAAGQVVFRYGGDGTGVVQFIDGTGAAHYVVGDHLGTVRALARADGSVESLGVFDAYGRPGGGAAPGNIGYTGGWTDPATGMVFLRSRWYSPESMRFITPDSQQPNPMQTSTFNRYAYCLGDPINRSDPTGQFGLGEMSAVMSIIGMMSSIAFSAFPSAKEWLVDRLIGKYVGNLDAVNYEVNFDSPTVGGFFQATAGFELLHFFDSGITALYFFIGVKAVFGGGGAGITLGLTPGFVFDTPKPGNYEGFFLSLTISANPALIQRFSIIKSAGDVVGQHGFGPFTGGLGVTFFLSPTTTDGHRSKGLVPLGANVSFGATPVFALSVTIYFLLGQLSPGLDVNVNGPSDWWNTLYGSFTTPWFV